MHQNGDKINGASSSNGVDKKKKKHKKTTQKQEIVAEENVEMTNGHAHADQEDGSKEDNGNVQAETNGTQLENSGQKKKKKRSQTTDENEEVQTKHKKRKAQKSTEESKNEPVEKESAKITTKSSISEEEAEAYRKEFSVSVSGADCSFPPVTSFEAAPFSEDMLASCKAFKKPTPIQAQCWPILLAGRDCIAIAETGSGKTIAFGLPALSHINKRMRGYDVSKGPMVLVLSPTRELAMQTADVCTAAGASCGYRSVCLYGGVEKKTQRNILQKGIHIVVATPGRLLDLISEGYCNLGQVSFLVLDEADRMLDMGFEKPIRAILKEIPEKRQTLMFSATWPVVIQQLASEFLNNPIRVTVGSEDLSANHKVKQIVDVMEPYGKDKRLEDLLNIYHKSRKNRVLVFALYKKEADRVEQTLRRKGWRVQSIHGDKSQAERTAAITKFKDGSEPLLIATDVAARGLDVPDVEYVINYTFPLTIEEYVHRIGRTGRGGKVGCSHTFFTVHDKAHAGGLMNVLREADQPVPEDLTQWGSHTKKKEHGLYGAHFKDITPEISGKKVHIKFGEES